MVVLILKVSGLDLSLCSAGVAVIDDDRQVYTYTFGNALKKGASIRKRMWRNIEICNGIIAVLKRHHVTVVAVEEYAFSRRSSSVHALAELGGLVKAQLLLTGIGCAFPIEASAVRKFLFGHNTSDKEFIRKKLCELGYGQPKNTDESDALAVALVADAYVNNRAQYSRDHELDLFQRLDARTA